MVRSLMKQKRNQYLVGLVSGLVGWLVIAVVFQVFSSSQEYFSSLATTTEISRQSSVASRDNLHNPGRSREHIELKSGLTKKCVCPNGEKTDADLDTITSTTYLPLPTIEGLLPLHSKNHQENDKSIARMLNKKVRVLCWVMTTPKRLFKKAIYSYNTWAHRCTKTLFFSKEKNSTFPAPIISLDIPEGKRHLTVKTMKAFKYIYDHHYDDADWFMKADDDTFAILENLRHFLSNKNPMEPVYYGCHFSSYVSPQGYFGGGAGYLISKEALRRYGEKGYKQAKLCRRKGGAEDAEFGKCMQNLGVEAGESLDKLGRNLSHQLSPSTFVKGKFPAWYNTSANTYGPTHDIESISDFPISFHYVKPKEMEDFVYYTYHLKLYGVNSKFKSSLHHYYSTQT